MEGQRPSETVTIEHMDGIEQNENRFVQHYVLVVHDDNRIGQGLWPCAFALAGRNQPVGPGHIPCGAHKLKHVRSEVGFTLQHCS
jgi:hypothetical protein